MRIIISCIILISLILNSCTENPVAPNPVSTFTQSPPVTRTDDPPTTTVITATPTLNYKNIILTPDDLFALTGLEAWSTHNSKDFCEHLPPPQIVANPSSFSILSGRFTLCPRESWPLVTNTTMDLDTGTLVSSDDPRGDLAMFNGRFGTSERPDYGVVNRNNAFLESARVLEKYANHPGANNLSSAYCENIVQGKTDIGVINVEEGVIACIRTTEGKIALIRVEKIYPSNTLSAEFSFAILKTVIATPIITQTASVTPGPSPTATNTPTDQELLDALDKNTRAFFDRPVSEIIDFLLEIQNSLRTSNKEKLANWVHYPITIYRFDGDNQKEIQNAEEFIANYELIVTTEWKNIVLSQEPARLFINWQGVRVSRGELWFTAVCTDESCQDSKLYIVAINHTDW